LGNGGKGREVSKKKGASFSRWEAKIGARYFARGEQREKKACLCRIPGIDPHEEEGLLFFFSEKKKKKLRPATNAAQKR